MQLAGQPPAKYPLSKRWDTAVAGSHLYTVQPVAAISPRPPNAHNRCSAISDQNFRLLPGPLLASVTRFVRLTIAGRF